MIKFLVILCFNNSVDIKRFLITLLIIIVSVVVLLSGERTSLALLILFIIFLFTSSFKLRKFLLIPVTVALITLTGIILNSETIKGRMIDTTINQLGLNEKSERLKQDRFILIYSKRLFGLE